MAVSLTLTPTTATASVDVTFDDDGTGVDIVTITRSTDTQAVLRGAAAAETSGGVFFTRDDEAPFGTVITYAVHDVDGDVIVSAATQLNVTDSWLKVPGQASLSLAVQIGNHDRADTYGTPQGVFAIEGSPYPIVVSGTMSARSTQVSLLTFDRATGTQLLRALKAAPTILLETPDGHALARGYFAVAGVSRKQYSRALSGDASEWTLPLIEVDIPSGAGDITGPTWDTVVDTYATWAELVAAHSTWLDLVQSL